MFFVKNQIIFCDYENSICRILFLVTGVISQGSIDSRKTTPDFIDLTSSSWYNVKHIVQTACQKGILKVAYM